MQDCCAQISSNNLVLATETHLLQLFNASNKGKDHHTLKLQDSHNPRLEVCL